MLQPNSRQQTSACQGEASLGVHPIFITCYTTNCSVQSAKHVKKKGWKESSQLGCVATRMVWCAASRCIVGRPIWESSQCHDFAIHQVALCSQQSSACQLKRVIPIPDVLPEGLVCAGSKPVHIGYFDSQQGAARAYDQEAIRLRGPNTSLNFPITDYDVSMPHGIDRLSPMPRLGDSLLAVMTSQDVHRLHMCIACQATALMALCLAVLSLCQAARLQACVYLYGLHT